MFFYIYIFITGRIKEAELQLEKINLIAKFIKLIRLTFEKNSLIED